MCYGDKAFFKCLELYSNKNAIKHWDKQIIDELKYFHICNLQAWINPLVVSIPKVNDLLHFQYLEMLKNLCCNIFHKIHVHTYLSCVAVLRLSITVHIWVLKYLCVTLFFLCYCYCIENLTCLYVFEKFIRAVKCKYYLKNLYTAYLNFSSSTVVLMSSKASLYSILI